MQMTQRLINEQGIYPLYLLKAKQEQKHKNNDNSKISKLKKKDWSILTEATETTLK